MFLMHDKGPQNLLRCQSPLLRYIPWGALCLPNTYLGCVEHMCGGKNSAEALEVSAPYFSLHGRRGFRDF